MSPFSINTRDSFYSLSAISGGIGDAVRQQFGERPYWVVAEISEMNVRKGHCYLSLVEKLPGSASPLCELKGIIWASKFEKIASAFVSQTGVVLAANTRILFQAFVRYDVKWGLSLVIEDIEPKYTAGLLQIERDRAVACLKADGEYGLNKSVDFPLVPSRIAVISAQDSKGYEDFLNKLHTNPEGYHFQVTLFSSLLQGEGAPGQITSRLVEIFNDIGSYDAVVIVRGGGGTIDLNCFNDYKLSRAVARFPVPVITGIGHTTNISVVDEVAHADCITPTAAADFLIQKCRDFEDYLMETMNGIVANYEFAAAEARSWLSEAAGALSANAAGLVESALETTLNLSDSIARSAAFVIREQQTGLKMITGNLSSLAGNTLRLQQQFIDRELSGRLLKAPLQSVQRTTLQLERLEAASRHLDPASVLKRGFSITRINGKAIVNAEMLHDGDEITTQFYEGTIQSKVISGGK